MQVPSIHIQSCAPGSLRDFKLSTEGVEKGVERWGGVVIPGSHWSAAKSTRTKFSCKIVLKSKINKV